MDQTMRKLHVVMLALVAVFAFSAVAAATASAEATLLAEWLIGGAGVTTLTSTTTTVGKIELEDKSFGAGVECEGIFDGSVGPNGEDETTEVLSKAGVAVTLAAPLTLTTGCKITKGCESAAGVEVAPEELPWHTLLYLVEATSKFRDLVFKAGYSVKCRILFVTSTDECKVTEGSFEVLAAAEGSEATGAVTPNANCSVGGTGAGTEKFVGANHLLDLNGNPVLPSSV
jgi:hypothetical protein